VIVIDASALTKYVLHEDGWDKVSKCLREMRPLYSVDHVLKECCNAIWRHTYIKKLINSTTALELLRRLLRLVQSQVIVLEPEAMYLNRALEISLNSGLTIYDALYIAQAEKYGELLTFDEKQAETAKSMGITICYLK